MRVRSDDPPHHERALPRSYTAPHINELQTSEAELVNAFLFLDGPIELYIVPTSIPQLVCVEMHIKEPLLLIGKSSPCGASEFPLSLSE